MSEFVSKSQFKPRALEYFRRIETTRKEVIITDRGKPVIRIAPFRSGDPLEALQSFRGTVRRYEDPTEPVGLEEWEALK